MEILHIGLSNLLTVDQLYTILYILLGVCIISGYIAIRVLFAIFRDEIGKR